MNVFVSELDFQTRRIDLQAHLEQKGKVGFSSIGIRSAAENGFGVACVEFCNKKDVFAGFLTSGKFLPWSHLRTSGFVPVGESGAFAGICPALN
jgi:hypothetical protein